MKWSLHFWLRGVVFCQIFNVSLGRISASSGQPVSVLGYPQYNTFSVRLLFIHFCLNGISCLSACAHWFFCHCMPLRVWLCLLTSSHHIFVRIDWIPLRLLHTEQVHLSVMPNAPVPSTLWLISGYALVCPGLLCTGKPRPRPSTPDMSYWDLVDGKNHCPEPADDTLQSIGY